MGLKNHKKMEKVILLYGPPGVGKLTVAREISKKTNFRVFHNHLISDMIGEFFESGTKEFSDKFFYLWTYFFKELLKSDNEGIIITLVYGLQTLEGKRDEEFFLRIKEEVEKNGTKVFFVKLECSNEEIKKRVIAKSRKKYKKLTSVSALEDIRKKYNIDGEVPFTESIVIDTTSLSAKKTAEKIIEKTKRR